MNIELSKEELSFLSEVLYWGKICYEEKAERYFKIKGYRENEYEPRIQNYRNLNAKIKQINKEIK